MEGHGSVGMYALARAVDLQDLEHLHEEANVLNTFKAVDEPGPSYECEVLPAPLDVLLFGVSDPSTLIKTIARARRHPTRQINFYILEPQATQLARLILLLYIAIDPSLDSLGFSDRAALFLELYGSLYFREKTHEWLMRQINDLIRIVTDNKGVVGKILNLDKLRFRDRDDLEFVFKFWKSPKPFALDQLWENRLAQFYRSQYDARSNMADWDYHMKMLENTKYLTKSEFVRWRLQGIAYEVRSASLTHPNRTLAAVEGLRDPKEGITKTKWGYFGDVCTGPFVAWGIDTESKDLLKTANDTPKYSTTEIAHHNVTCCLAELLTGRPDRVKVETYVSESTKAEIVEELPAEDVGTAMRKDAGSIAFAKQENDTQGQALLEETRLTLPPFKVHLLPADPSKVLDGRFKFDIAVVGTCLAHRAGQVAQRLSSGGTLLCETARWYCELKAEHRAATCEKLVELVTEASSLVLVKDHVRNLKQKDGSWAKLGNAWDYLAFQEPLQSPASTANNLATQDLATASG